LYGALTSAGLLPKIFLIKFNIIILLVDYLTNFA
jgi:hypothetical protein